MPFFIQFPHSNVQMILMKLRSLDGIQQEQLTSMGSGVMTQDHFRTVVSNVMQDRLSEHEIVTLARHYGKTRSTKVDCSTLAAQAQQQLKSANFRNFNKLHELCLHRDHNRCGITSS